MDQEIPVPRPTSPATRRKPRYVLRTFWLLVGPLMIAYSVYLYRGGRFGIVTW